MFAPQIGDSQGVEHLVVNLGELMGALPLADLKEVVPPLPIAPIAGTPSFVLGLSRVRGRPCPVVDLAALLGLIAPPPRLWVLLQVDKRAVALAVSGVEGVRSLDEVEREQTPRLLSEALAGAEIANLDAGLCVLLEDSRALSARVWTSLRGKLSSSTGASRPAARPT